MQVSAIVTISNGVITSVATGASSVTPELFVGPGRSNGHARANRPHRQGGHSDAAPTSSSRHHLRL